MLRLHCIFPAILRKQNALPICSLLLVIFKTLQKLTLSSAASAYCLWKQFQSTFCKGKKKSPASKVLQVFALFSSIVLLTKKKKRNSLEPWRHWVSLSCSLFFTLGSQTAAFKQWPFSVEASWLFWVVFPCWLFSLPPAQPSPQVAAGSREGADRWQPFGSPNGWPRKCQLLEVATDYMKLGNTAISHLIQTV